MTKALVILSGGQDSTTCLFWAKQHFGPDAEIHAITFDYNQRHRREIEAARKVAEMAGVASHEVVELGPVLKGTSPLVNSEAEVEKYESPETLPGGLEKTFVPGRNALFLVLAANYAMAHTIRDIVLGVAQEDFGGYPDCRQRFITSMQESMGLAMADKPQFFRFHTPLMRMSKAETVKLAADLRGCLDALAHSHTCYDGEYPPNPSNHASLLRAKGFRDANIPDPLILRAKAEGLLPSDYDEFGLPSKSMDKRLKITKKATKKVTKKKSE